MAEQRIRLDVNNAKRSAVVATYLQQHVAQLQAAGLTATALVSRGEPAKVIEHTARQVNSDLIVLGTHGKTSIDAFWLGSITPKVSNQPHVPLLLVPVGEPESGL
jgi:nucleotide-binding universal stress UspA family protein